MKSDSNTINNRSSDNVNGNVNNTPISEETLTETSTLLQRGLNQLAGSTDDISAGSGSGSADQQPWGLCAPVVFPIPSTIVEDMTTFEAIPDEVLMKEVEEHHRETSEREHKREDSSLFDGNPLFRTVSEFFVHDETPRPSETATPTTTTPLTATDENAASSPGDGRDGLMVREEGELGDMTEQTTEDEEDEVILTYPEEQVIESHFTSSPEKLGLVPLAVLVFYNVSGGPFGIETTVRAGGHFYALLGFLIMPFVWSLQEALMTAELGTTFVEASGGVAWVEEAFGPGAGWISGYLGWIAGATDNAIYPVLFLDYLLAVIGGKANSIDDDGNGDGESETLHPMLRFLALSTTSIILAYINWKGLPVVGKMSVAICLISMSPFVILIVVGAFKCDPSRWLERPTASTQQVVAGMDDDITGGFFPNAVIGGILWRPYLNNLFWNLNSFVSCEQNISYEKIHAKNLYFL
jgi:Amino acid permease